jgi:acyl-homoserine lactone acylase PvdQ
MTIPSIFYPIEMVIVDKNNDIVDQAFGVMSDGLPGISMGKNQYFAWGSTSLYADSKDVFVETVRENDQGIKEYFYENQWLPLKIREEVFSVRGSGTYTDIYYETHRGPLLSSIFMDIHLKYGFPISKHH